MKMLSVCGCVFMPLQRGTGDHYPSTVSTKAHFVLTQGKLNPMFNALSKTNPVHHIPTAHSRHVYCKCCEAEHKSKAANPTLGVEFVGTDSSGHEPADTNPVFALALGRYNKRDPGESEELGCSYVRSALRHRLTT